jgi:hypothetical protein
MEHEHSFLGDYPSGPTAGANRTADAGIGGAAGAVKGDDLGGSLRFHERAQRSPRTLANNVRPYSAGASRSDKKWSSRRTLVFVVGASGALWAGIICLCARYI